jgi:hypothetical protein
MIKSPLSPPGFLRKTPPAHARRLMCCKRNTVSMPLLMSRDIRSLRLKRYSLIVALDAAIVSTIQDLVGTDGVQIEKWDIPNRRGFH